MPRSRVESLLTSFPKLIPPNSQHTSVETTDVRYVYQPLEELYILLITNKASNILQDIDTLHLFARVVSDLCRNAEEKEIIKNQFELMGAFDEVVSLGYREPITLTQVRSVLEMESHEEKIQEIIARVRYTSSPVQSLCQSPCSRIRRQRQRRSSKDERSSLKCSEENSNAAWLRVALPTLAETVVGSGLYPTRVGILPFHASRRRPRCRGRNPPSQKSRHPLSKAPA